MEIYTTACRRESTRAPEGMVHGWKTHSAAPRGRSPFCRRPHRRSPLRSSRRCSCLRSFPKVPRPPTDGMKQATNTRDDSGTNGLPLGWSLSRTGAFSSVAINTTRRTVWERGRKSASPSHHLTSPPIPIPLYRVSYYMCTLCIINVTTKRDESTQHQGGLRYYVVTDGICTHHIKNYKTTYNEKKKKKKKVVILAFFSVFFFFNVCYGKCKKKSLSLLLGPREPRCKKIWVTSFGTNRTR